MQGEEEGCSHTNSEQWKSCSSSQEQLPLPDAAKLPPKAKGSLGYSSVLERRNSLNYQALPQHRRLWSWGWSSSASSMHACDQPVESSIQACSSAEEDPADSVAWAGHFPIRRGGTVVFTFSAKKSFNIAVYTEANLPAGQRDGGLPHLPWVGVRVGSQSAELVFAKGPGFGLRVLASTHFQGVGFGSGGREAFWLSFDPDNRTIKYGKGSRMLEQTCLTYTFEGKGLEPFGEADKQILSRLFSPVPKLIQLQHYTGPPVVEHTLYETPLMAQRVDQVASVTFDRTPLVLDPSPRLLEDSQMILSDYSHEDFTFPASLPPVAQALANQVLQPWLTLEDPSDSQGPKLADAISYSLSTPGAFLHTMLEEKIARLPKGLPACQTQLSIALAPCNGRSPGPPFTLEILPPGHCSAPHNNSNSFGVLRVLHGNLEVDLFDTDLAAAEVGAPLDEVELDQGDTMWFSPEWYQTHGMRNEAAEYCCYLLARQYADEDEVRWPYIQYKGLDGNLCSAEPVADLAFKEFYSSVMIELEDALKHNSDLLKKTADLTRSGSTRTEAWVERTDSAFNYEVCSEMDEEAATKGWRYGCSSWKRRSLKPYREPRFLLQPPPIEEEPADSLSMMWP